MNAVEIEEAVSALAAAPFDARAFPYRLLEAFGNKKTTLDRLRKGNSNASDIDGAVLQRNHIHIAVCAEGEVSQTLTELKASPATGKARNKVKFILATDGLTLEAEDLKSGETLACEYQNFLDHFGFFLPLAGISTIQQIRESAFDIKATGRLNRLYVALLQDNPGWGEAQRRHDMNHFMARLIFCFFAEDTDIFNGDDPRISNFFHYFSHNFASLKLKNLIATCYKNQERDLFSRNNSEQAIYQLRYWIYEKILTVFIQ